MVGLHFKGYLIFTFEHRVEKYPNSIALVYKNLSLTFDELNRKSNQLARYFLDHADLKPDDLVGLILDKSDKMIIAILAVWKTGAAYVPISPTFPNDRISFMLDDTKSSLVFTDKKYKSNLESISKQDRTPILYFDEEILCVYSKQNLGKRNNSTNLAYAIYTSGTTGKPKAVLIEHVGVVNLHFSLDRLFSFSTNTLEKTFLSFSNFVFDHFIEQMTDALLSGHKLVVLDDELR